MGGLISPSLNFQPYPGPKVLFMLRWTWLRHLNLAPLTWRGLLIRRTRTLLTLLGIIVGVAVVVAVDATNSSTLAAINGFFDQTAGQSDLWISSNIRGESFDEGILTLARRAPGVALALPTAQATTLAAEDADAYEIQYGAGGALAPGTNFWALGVDPLLDPQAHDYQLVAGRLLEADETSYSLILVDEYAQDKEVEVGDDFELLTPVGGITRFRVVGLIAKEGIGLANAGVVGIMPLSVAQELFNLGGRLTQIEVVAADVVAAQRADLEQLRRELQDLVGDDLNVDYPASRGELVVASIQNYQVGLNFFSIVSIFVGSFLIYNTFAMTVVERTREIGMMRALGMTRRQSIGMVLTEAIILGLLGSILGVGFGLALARGLIGFMASYTAQTISVVSAEFLSLLRAVALGIVVTLSAAALPALQSGRVSPLQALRVQGRVDESRWRHTGLRFGPITVLSAIGVIYYVPLRPEMAAIIGQGAIFFLLLGATLCIPLLIGPLERLAGYPIRRLFGNEGRLGSANIKRAQGRTTLTVAALMVGISMVIGIQGLTDSFSVDIDSWMNTALAGDMTVYSTSAMRPEIENRLLALPEVTAITRSRFVTTRLIFPDRASEFAIFDAIDPHTFLNVRNLQVDSGPDPAGIIAAMAQGQAVYISADTATRYALAVGDTLVLETRRGEQPFRIAGIVIDFSGGELPVITGTWSDLRRYFGLRDVSRFALNLTPGADLDALEQRIEKDISRGDQLVVETRAEFQEKVRALSGEALSLFDVLGAIGLVVAALGVINTMLMNVFERTRELGGLRSLGMSQAQVRRMIMAEATAIGFIGAIFGLGFGAVLTDVFIIGLRQIGGFALTRQTPYGAMAWSFWLAIGVAVAASLYPAWRAGRVNIIEAIKHE